MMSGTFSSPVKTGKKRNVERDIAINGSAVTQSNFGETAVSLPMSILLYLFPNFLYKLSYHHIIIRGNKN